MESSAPAKYRVMLAEDDEAIRRTLQSLLELKGHTVSFAANTPDTLAILADEEFDLIISDYLMPGGGGREILRFLKENNRDMAVIMVTGLADEQLFQELTAIGVDRCLSKPFRLAALLETIDEIMAERAQK